jgi:membrane-bound lytic murein transglycosylase D
VALAAASLLLGCAAHDRGAVGTLDGASPGGGGARAAASAKAAEPSQPAAAPSLTDRFEAASPSAPAVAAARDRLDETFERGRAAWLAGDADRAFELFDEALDPILSASFDLHAEPELRARVEEVLAAVHEMTVAAGVIDDPAAEERELARAALEPQGQGAATRARLEEDLAAVVGNSVYAGPYTVPMHDDPAVDSMVAFYTGAAKDRFELGLARYGRFAPTVRRILREEGLPADLCWLALVESNYNPRATSHARARGLWQFIPSTGRKYGLAQDFWVDERADFEKATRSAAAYLRFLHGELGDWHLALAAYNAGEGRIGRGIKATGRSDYWHLRRTRHIRNETKTYVPAFLAVLRIVRDPAAHGITLAPEEPYAWEVARIDEPTDLTLIAERGGIDLGALRDLNPELLRDVTPGGSPYRLRVPAGSAGRVEQVVARLPAAERLRWRQHRVERGDTLSTVAARHGSSVAAIMAANDLRDPNRIAVGASLVIPTGPGAGSLAGTGPVTAARGARAASTPAAPERRAAAASYRVRPGDTLSRIAERHGTTVSDLARSNRLGSTDHIRVGQRLAIASAAAPVAARTCVVQRGDTLSAIARRHGCSVADLRAWNGLGADGLIHPGQELTVKGDAARARTHTVRTGDTLFAIARAYRTTVDQLRAWNDLNRRQVIHPGERLTVFTD